MGLDEQQLLFELDQDPAVMKYINGGKLTTMDQIEQHFMPRLSKYHNPQKGWGLWKVIAKQVQAERDVDIAGKYLGWILVRPMYFFSDKPAFNDIEFGWRFKQSSWGKGIATEAATAVMELIQAQPDVEFISAIADESNQGSINIMKKLGMTFVKKGLHQDPLGDYEVVYYQKPV